ncbi:MAG: DUF5681 domain-containing protein [Pseudomonadota bacterium]
MVDGSGLPPPKDGSYEVGYGKPPKDTRFRPGQSGNPKGRPKGAKGKKQGNQSPLEEPLDQLILEEGNRNIVIRDGDKLVKMPIIQAVMRNLALKAAKGDYRSQRLFLESTNRVEAKQKALADELAKTLMQHKADAEAELARRKELGIEGPPIYPHPDDVVINFATGDVKVQGPLDKNEEDYVSTAVFKAEIEEKIKTAEEKVAKKPNSKAAKEHLEALLSVLKNIEERLATHPGGGRFR